MITDEQRKAFEQWAKSQGCIVAAHDNGNYLAHITGHLFEAWKAAQNVRGIAFVRELNNGFIHADTPIGMFILYRCAEGVSYNETMYGTEAEAIEAANEDYQRRVLSCLVNGGV